MNSYLTISKEFSKLLTHLAQYTDWGYDFQELEVQGWPGFTLPYMAPELIKCIGYSNRSCIYVVLVRTGKVYAVSYDSAIIK